MSRSAIQRLSQQNHSLSNEVKSQKSEMESLKKALGEARTSSSTSMKSKAQELEKLRIRVEKLTVDLADSERLATSLREASSSSAARLDEMTKAKIAVEAKNEVSIVMLSLPRRL